MVLSCINGKNLVVKLGRFVMKWSFQGVGPEISAQDVREKKPRVVLQDYYQPREAKPREVGNNLKTPQEAFLRTSRAEILVRPRENSIELQKSRVELLNSSR